MGAYSPAPAFTDAVRDDVMARIIRPTLAEMARRGAPFRGVLFAGLMLTRDGPKLIEFNVRFGDPECQAMMLRLDSDLLAVLRAACDGKLNRITLRWRDDAGLVVVMAAEGYPGTPRKGSAIRGLDGAARVPGAVVFHAGTALRDGMLLAEGGRVLGIGATGVTLRAARDAAYAAVAQVDWPGGFCRRDIGWRALERAA
jgi:phosphoribosylamine--glycine ligase